MIIRNDDVAVDTDVKHLREFCAICDAYNIPIIQAITIYGKCIPIDICMTNENIRMMAKEDSVFDNKELIEFLQQRNDIIGLHGLYHTHEPTEEEISHGKDLLSINLLNPTYFVTPFNQGNYPPTVSGLVVSQHTQRLEDYLYNTDIPTDNIVYLHSWRFDGSWYSLKDLDLCLKRITTSS